MSILLILVVSFAFSFFVSSSSSISIPILVGQGKDITKRIPVNRTVLDRIPNGIKNGLASGLAAAVCKGIFADFPLPTLYCKAVTEKQTHIFHIKGILLPFDTIKTVQQTGKVFMGPLKTTMSIIQTRGVIGLWSGLGVTVLGSSPSVAVYFGVYSTAKTHLTRLLPDKYKLVAVSVAAALGNTVASGMHPSCRDS